MSIGQDESAKARKETFRVWKKAKPGIAGEIGYMLEKAYNAGYDAGRARGLELRGCCHDSSECAEGCHARP